MCGCECICGGSGCGGEIGHILIGQVPLYKYQVFCGSRLGSTSFLATALADHTPTIFSPMSRTQGSLHSSPRSGSSQTLVTQGEGLEVCGVVLPVKATEKSGSLISERAQIY